MATKIQLTPVSQQELARIAGLPAAKEIETKFARNTVSAAEGRAALKKWQEEQPEPKPPRNPEITVAAVEPTTAALAKLAAVVDSESAPAELVNQKFDEATFTGALYSAFLTHQFMRHESDNKRKRASARTRAEAEREWPQIVDAYQKAFALAGVQGVDEQKLSRYAKNLAGDRRSLDAITKIVNSAEPAGRETDKAPAAARAVFVPATARIIDLSTLVNVIPNLCALPLAQGTFTKHFSRTFNFSISFGAPCWPKFWKWCNYTVTVASVSFDAGVNVAYKVTCCAATASGQGYAQACGSVPILGVTACASCSATITGVAGISKTTTGGGCNYGLGINASLVCKLGNSTVFSASAPFGYTISGPCPPLPC